MGKKKSRCSEGSTMSTRDKKHGKKVKVKDRRKVHKKLGCERKKAGPRKGHRDLSSDHTSSTSSSHARKHKKRQLSSKKRRQHVSSQHSTTSSSSSRRKGAA